LSGVSSQNLAKDRAAARQFTDVFCTHNIKKIKTAHPLMGAVTFQLNWKIIWNVTRTGKIMCDALPTKKISYELPTASKFISKNSDWTK